MRERPDSNARVAGSPASQHRFPIATFVAGSRKRSPLGQIVGDDLS